MVLTMSSRDPCDNPSSYPLPLLRSKIDLESTQALYLLVSERSMSCMSSSMGDVYSQYSDPDGFLYITYASQDMFGGDMDATPPC